MKFLHRKLTEKFAPIAGRTPLNDHGGARYRGEVKTSPRTSGRGRAISVHFPLSEFAPLIGARSGRGGWGTPRSGTSPRRPRVLRHGARANHGVREVDRWNLERDLGGVIPLAAARRLPGEARARDAIYEDMDEERWSG